MVSRLHSPVLGRSVESHQFLWAGCRGEGLQRQGWLTAGCCTPNMHLGVFVKGQDRPERRNSYVNTRKMGKTNISASGVISGKFSLRKFALGLQAMYPDKSVFLQIQLYFPLRVQCFLLCVLTSRLPGLGVA